MSFLHPGFLFALAVLAIPVIIHLFHFRRYKTIRFPDLRFLKNIQTERKNRNTLKHLLILMSRLGAFASLVLAFAIPGCGETKTVTAKKQVVVFVDNSYSMSQKGKEGILFETAKNKAREIVKSFGNTAEFRIVSHDLPRAEHVYVPEKEAIAKIDELKITAASVSVKKLWNVLAGSAASGNAVVYIISDFQSSFLREIPVADTALQRQVYGMKLNRDAAENVSLDSAWLANPFALAGEKNQLIFRVRNYGDQKINGVNIRLQSGNTATGLAQIDVDAGAEANGTMDIVMPPAEGGRATLLLDDEGYAFDNSLDIALNPQPPARIQLAGRNVYLDSALSKNSFFKMSRSGKPDFRFPQFAAVYTELKQITEGSSLADLKEYLSSGGQVVLYPAVQAEAGDFTVAGRAFGFPKMKPVTGGMVKLASSGLSHPFFNQVFRTVPAQMEMPGVKQYFSSSGALGNGEAILSLENGDPFLLKFRHGKGVLYLFASAPDPVAGNFVQSVLFFPVVSNTALGAGKNAPLFAYAASSSGLALMQQYPTEDGRVVLKYGQEELMPEIQYGPEGQEIFIGPAMDRPGFYQLAEKGGRTGEWIALNPPRTESDPATAGEEKTTLLEKNTGLKWIQPSAVEQAAQTAGGTSGLWRLFIWLAAVFFAVEVLLLVFWDAAARKLFPMNKIKTE